MKIRYSSYYYASIFEVWFSIGSLVLLRSMQLGLLLKQESIEAGLKLYVKCCKFLSSGAILKSPSNVMFS